MIKKFLISACLIVMIPATAHAACVDDYQKNYVEYMSTPHTSEIIRGAVVPVSAMAVMTVLITVTGGGILIPALCVGTEAFLLKYIFSGPSYKKVMGAYFYALSKCPDHIMKAEYCRRSYNSITNKVHRRLKKCGLYVSKEKLETEVKTAIKALEDDEKFCPVINEKKYFYTEDSFLNLIAAQVAATKSNADACVKKLQQEALDEITFATEEEEED